MTPNPTPKALPNTRILSDISAAMEAHICALHKPEHLRLLVTPAGRQAILDALILRFGNRSLYSTDEHYLGIRVEQYPSLEGHCDWCLALKNPISLEVTHRISGRAEGSPAAPDRPLVVRFPAGAVLGRGEVQK